MTAWEGMIATRTRTARLCTTLGVVLLAAGLVFALLPGSPASCGSLLAPLYPPDEGIACSGAQGTWVPELLGAVAVGLLLLAAGAALAPSRRSRRRR